MSYPNDYDPVYSHNGASGSGVGGAIDISASVVAGYPPVMLVTFTGTATYVIQGSHDNFEWNDYTPSLTSPSARDLIPGIRFWRSKITSNNGRFTASVGPVPAAFGRYVRPVLVSEPVADPNVSISGRIMDAGVGLAGVSVSDGTRTATTDGDGYYTITDVPPNTVYTITPALAGYAFTPVTSTEAVAGEDVPDIIFEGFTVGGNGNVIVNVGWTVLYSPDVRTTPGFVSVSPAWGTCTAYRISTRDDFAFVSGGDQFYPIAIYRISTGTLLSAAKMKADDSLSTFARAVMNRRHTHVLIPATVVADGTTVLAVYSFDSTSGSITWVRNISAPTGAFGGTAQNNNKVIVFDENDTAYVLCTDGIRTYPSPYTAMDVFWPCDIYTAFPYAALTIMQDRTHLVFLQIHPLGGGNHGISAVPLPLTAGSVNTYTNIPDANISSLSVSAQNDYAIVVGNTVYRIPLPVADGGTVTTLGGTGVAGGVNSFTLGDGTGIAAGYATLKILDAPYDNVAASVTITPNAVVVGGD